MSTAAKVFSIDGSANPKQRIHTPPGVLDPLKRLWPAGVQLDPCGSPDSLVEAAHTFGPEFEIQDGLSVPWPKFAFINPPYKHLKAWLAHGMQFDEQVWLVPVRPHRKWWRAARRKCDAMVWCDPIAFVGYDQKFPAPLCMFYRGERACWFGQLFEHLGEVEYIDREPA